MNIEAVAHYIIVVQIRIFSGFRKPKNYRTAHIRIAQETYNKNTSMSNFSYREDDLYIAHLGYIKI